MRWKRSRRSTNIDDRRSAGVGRRLPGGFKLGGGATILIVIAGLIFGFDPSLILNLLGGGPGVSTTQSYNPGSSAADDEMADFVTAVLGDTEDTWNQLLPKYGEQYRPPTLVLYSGMTQTACGMGSAASGPFYCPGDYQVYLDLSFFQQLKRMGAPGDFAGAYVIAHEVAHHIQNLLGTERKVREIRSQVSQAQSNALSVLVELQADCYAGVWAHHAHQQRDILEKGDVEEGLNAAAAVGDDRLMEAAGKRVHPDSFTHGTSEQRVRWFRTGLQSGDLQACDTFAAASQ